VKLLCADELLVGTFRLLQHDELNQPKSYFVLHIDEKKFSSSFQVEISILEFSGRKNCEVGRQARTHPILF
jgi:hypothetical protein